MGRLRAEYVYTSTGPQRPVFLHPECRNARYTLDAEPPDGGACVQVSHDPPATVQRGRAQWLTHSSGPGGGVYGVTAIRAVLPSLDGWATLTVEQEIHHAADR